MKTPTVLAALLQVIEPWIPKRGRSHITAAHAAILKNVEMALDRDRKGIEVLTQEQALIYLKQMEHVMVGPVGDREWGLHEALKAKGRK